MRASRERLLPYAQLLPYMAATRQPVGLRTLGRLAEVLRPLGLSDEDLTLAVVLIGSTTMGFASYESRRSPAEEIAAVLQEGLALRPEEERRTTAPLLPHLPAAHARLYETVLDQTVAAIESLNCR